MKCSYLIFPITVNHFLLKLFCWGQEQGVFLWDWFLMTFCACQPSKVVESSFSTNFTNLFRNNGKLKSSNAFQVVAALLSFSVHCMKRMRIIKKCTKMIVGTKSLNIPNFSQQKHRPARVSTTIAIVSWVHEDSTKLSLAASEVTKLYKKYGISVYQHFFELYIGLLATCSLKKVAKGCSGQHLGKTFCIQPIRIMIRWWVPLSAPSCSCWPSSRFLDSYRSNTISRYLAANMNTAFVGDWNNSWYMFSISMLWNYDVDRHVASEQKHEKSLKHLWKFSELLKAINAALLLLVVLAGLLPQFATIVIRFTEASLNLTTWQRSQARYALSQLSPSIFTGQSVTWSLVIQHSVGVF